MLARPVTMVVLIKKDIVSSRYALARVAGALPFLGALIGAGGAVTRDPCAPLKNKTAYAVVVSE